MGNIIYKVNRGGKKHPSWAYNAVIYELNTRQFTPSGTLVEAIGHLDRLKKLGVDIIWMMPIYPIGEERRKGSLGSYYSIADYMEVNSEFGTKEDFKAFVEAAHSLGIYVILDWVANHTSRDARWTKEHPDWYEWDREKGEIATPFDWSDTAKLNYANYDMRTEMIRSMRYWMEEYAVDGFRCDMAMLVPLDFWESATSELEGVSAAQGKELFMLAESEGEEFHGAFDATYAWEEHHILKRIAQGEANCFTLGERLGFENSKYDYNALRMHFTSNHDENSWNGSEIERMGGAVEALAALTYILSGMPLIYNGQEVALDRSLEFFERDTINWDELRESERAQNVERLYTRLSQLKHTHPALLGGDRGGDIVGIDNEKPWQVFAVKRAVGTHTVIALFNLSGEAIDTKFFDSDLTGTYTELLWQSTQESVTQTLNPNDYYHLNAWEFRIFYTN